MTDTQDRPAADQALRRLLDGNARFVAGAGRHAAPSEELRAALTEGQAPFATVLSCSDSRVAPSLVFDQSLGDLFIVRVAGHVLDTSVLGSLEFAAVMLATPLILVMGHQACGAVDAAVHGRLTDLHIDELVAGVAPAVEEARGEPGDLVDNAVRAHARLTAERLRTRGPVLPRLVEEGSLRILPAYYALSTGRVELLSEGPAS